MWGRPVPGASALSAFGCLLLLLRYGMAAAEGMEGSMCESISSCRTCVSTIVDGTPCAWCSGGCAAPAAAACAAAGAAGSTCGGGTDAAVSFIYLAFIGVFTLLGCCLWGLARRAHHALAARAAMLRVHQLPHFRWGVAPACARGGSTVGGSGSGGGGAEDGVEPSAKCPLCEGAGCAKAAPECSVCLSSFEAGEEVRQLPCKHLYHKACIDKWFESQKDTCPLCMVPVWEQRIAPRGGRRRARAAARRDRSRRATVEPYVHNRHHQQERQQQSGSDSDGDVEQGLGGVPASPSAAAMERAASDAAAAAAALQDRGPPEERRAPEPAAAVTNPVTPAPAV